MSMMKRATFEVLAAQMGSIPAPTATGPGLSKTAHRWNPVYDPKPGFLYVRSRAISSRTNDNFDNFPAEEIREGWRTFIGKPVFVNHHNANHQRARGVNIDAVLHEDVTADGKPDTWVEVLMEVDAVRFPKLAQAILRRKINRTSMGTSVGLSVCSYCGNEAEDASQFCRHIPAMKGQRIVRTTNGVREAVLVYEICRKLAFFENSLLVEDPADPTAYVTGVDSTALEGDPVTAGMLSTASKRESDDSAPEQRFSQVAINLSRALESNHEKIEAAMKRNASRGLGFRMKVGGTTSPLDHQVNLSSIVPTDTEVEPFLPNLPKIADLGSTGMKFRMKVGGLSKMAQETAGPNHLPTDPVYLRLNSHRARDRFQSQVLQGDVLYPLVSFDGPAVYAVEAEVWERYQSGRAIPGVSKARAPRLDDYMNPIGWSTTASVRPDVCAVHNVTAPADLFKTATSTLDFCDACIEERYMRPMAATALGEQRAPRQVDTLRDEACPVCSNTAFNDGACNMCGYIEPPLIFRDPAVEKAKDNHLRDTSMPNAVDLACDDCGSVFPAEGGDKSHTAAAKPWEDEDDAADEADADDDPEGDAGEDAQGFVGDDDGDGPQAPRTVPHPESLEAQDAEDLNPADDPTERAPKRGDLCPECGIGTLTPKDELEGIEPSEEPEDDEEEESSTSPDVEAQTPDEDEDDEFDPDGEPKEESRHMSNRNPERPQRPRESLHAKVSAVQAESRQGRERTDKQVEMLGRQNTALRRQMKEQGEHLALLVQTLADVATGKNTSRVAALKAHAAETAHPGNSETAAPETTEDVESQGSTDGANEGVTPEATTTVTEETVALEDNGAAPTNTTDVTELSSGEVPDDGGMVPDYDPTDLPSNSQTADGDVQWSGSTTSARLISAIRLARLRMAAKVATDTNDLVLGQRIASSNATDDGIRSEIQTLEQVMANRGGEAPTRQASRRSVPRSAAGGTTPSLAGRQVREASVESSVPADIASSVEDSLY